MENDTVSAQLLVRAYSFEVEERLPADSSARPLARILAKHHSSVRDSRDPWRLFFEPPSSNEGTRERNPITQVLEVETKQLQEKWRSFLESSPKADRLNLQSSEATMKGVIDTVRTIQETWESKRDSGRLAKASRLFHRFCGTLRSHKLFLELLPAGNEYVSIFSGTLNLVIHASANHEKVAEGLSEALCTVSQHVDDHHANLKMYDTDEMRILIADLYAHIFLLLGSVMDWMAKKRRKRLLDSFNEDLSEVFEGEIAKVKAISDRVRQRAEQSGRAELRYTRLAVENSARDIRAGLEGQERQQADMRYFAESIAREQIRLADLWAEDKQQQLAEKVVNMLEERAIRWLRAGQTPSAAPQGFLTTTLLSLGGPNPEDVVTPLYSGCRYTSEVIIQDSCHLEDYFHRDRVRFPADAFDPVMVQPEYFRPISDWAKSPPPRLLWFEGPALEADDFDNPLSMMAATTIALAAQTKLPIISYFCELRRGERVRPGNDTREAQAALSLIYALIRQLMELLALEFHSDVDLSRHRLESLDGSLGTWSAAISLLVDLGGLMPGPILCVIDGYHHLGDRSTDRYLSDLLKVLRGSKWKVLLFTTGRSAVLREEVLRSETIFVDTRQSFGRGVALGTQAFGHH
ncbi:phytanoyl- dioxygenase family protein [Colletotrichum sojae]|uniref:Phytanoyl- dioxygenase family protein n=1 Tax=Colletotrichum sojae TaxID=2175907 RepID=A0A8H6ISF1_9PEZI|nr:phytanoyl- dioxygenase family protein [Colletotrichum sojae]